MHYHNSYCKKCEQVTAHKCSECLYCRVKAQVKQDRDFMTLPLRKQMLMLKQQVDKLQNTIEQLK